VLRAALVILGMLAFLGVGAFALWWARRAPTEKAYYFRCPGCRHKLRGFVRQVGHKGQCQNCREVFTFPPPAK
jgi:prepilin signal peptidase PulO-like enzyme (type II secretory pathway)